MIMFTTSSYNNSSVKLILGHIQHDQIWCYFSTNANLGIGLILFRIILSLVLGLSLHIDNIIIVSEIVDVHIHGIYILFE